MAREYTQCLVQQMRGFSYEAREISQADDSEEQHSFPWDLIDVSPASMVELRDKTILDSDRAALALETQPEAEVIVMVLYSPTTLPFCFDSTITDNQRWCKRSKGETCHLQTLYIINEN